MFQESPKPKGCPLLMARVAATALLLIWLVVS
jgi:hypothetical protein